MTADGLLFAYTDPGPVPPEEFNDWYDTEHGPARLSVLGISAAYRYRAIDGELPPWLALYEMTHGTTDSPEYRALAASASAREKSMMSRIATLDRRVYQQVSSDGPELDGPAPTVLIVAISVPPAVEDDMAAWYIEEHIPMLLTVPGWRRIRRFRLTRALDGPGPDFLSVHELAGPEVLEEPGYRAAISTPWRDRVVASALRRERRVFGLRNAIRA